MGPLGHLCPGGLFCFAASAPKLPVGLLLPHAEIGSEPLKDVDQRKYIRYEVLEYALVYAAASLEPLHVVIVNIGLGGLQLRSRDRLPVGERCQFHVGMIDRPPLILPGEVRHCVPVPGSDLVSTGVRFQPRTHEERLAIAEYVHSVFQRQCDLLAM